AALCVEVRKGQLHMFLPPVPLLEDFISLIASIESTVQALGMRVRLEGYAPPDDPRLGRFAITPDPGVIEVNIHPASDWDELKQHVETLYEEARLTRLGTEKFMLDGRHTGTGGGKDRKSTRLNSSHLVISYAVFCLKKKKHKK